HGHVGVEVLERHARPSGRFDLARLDGCRWSTWTASARGRSRSRGPWRPCMGGIDEPRADRLCPVLPGSLNLVEQFSLSPWRDAAHIPFAYQLDRVGVG